MGIVVIGAVFVDIKGYPEATYIPGGRNAGSVEYTHGGVGRNVAEDIANVELRPTLVSLVDTSASGADVVNKLKNHKVNTNYIRATKTAWALGWRFSVPMATLLLPFPSVLTCLL